MCCYCVANVHPVCDQRAGDRQPGTLNTKPYTQNTTQRCSFSVSIALETKKKKGFPHAGHHHNSAGVAGARASAEAFARTSGILLIQITTIQIQLRPL